MINIKIKKRTNENFDIYTASYDYTIGDESSKDLETKVREMLQKLYDSLPMYCKNDDIEIKISLKYTPEQK